MPNSYVYSFRKFHNGVIRPFVPIIIINPHTNKALFIEALLDTGADKCLFPEVIATQTGHILKNNGVEMTSTMGAGGLPINTWRHTFRIELLEEGTRKVVWKGKPQLVDCAEHNNIPPLLGTGGFLEFLNIRFNYKTGKIIIELP